MLFNHVLVGTNDLEKARVVCDAVMGPLDYVNGASQGAPLLSYRSGNPGFAARAPRNGKAATIANGGTIGFCAGDVDQVAAFHRAGLANGGPTTGPLACARTVTGSRTLPIFAIQTSTRFARPGRVRGGLILSQGNHRHLQKG